MIPLQFIDFSWMESRKTRKIYVELEKWTMLTMIQLNRKKKSTETRNICVCCLSNGYFFPFIEKICQYLLNSILSHSERENLFIFLYWFSTIIINIALFMLFVCSYALSRCIVIFNSSIYVMKLAKEKKN